MKFLKETVLAVCAATQALALPSQAPPGEIQTALANLGVDVATIPQLSGNPTENGCQIACNALSHIHGSEKVIANNTTAYQSITHSYWSAQQGEVKPACIFAPTVDTDVSIVILLSQLTQCPFAAKSGGHAAFSGASNSQGGITILFRDLNEITLNEDRSVASIGPGNNWGQVYKALERHDVTVVGGRMSDIGVGGLLTGGGISYCSNLYGWALDNVESFEVVSAIDGNILTASATQHPDLYWALRGGGNNFGLVTKFNLYTFPGSLLRGGTRVFSEDQFSNVISAFVDVAEKANDDPNAQQYVMFANLGGTNVASAELTYAQNVSNPAIFETYHATPAISDSTSSRTMSQYADDGAAQDPYGMRDVFWNRSYKLDEDFANWVVKLWLAVLPRISSISNAMAGLTFQAITDPILEKMTRAGGNALGLDESNGPILLLHVLGMWNGASGDDAIYRLINDFFANVTAEADSRGLGNKFIYMNYASHVQDVIASYGADNKAKLQKIASKYDPAGVYQTLQPGHFKLTRSPVPNPY
ncbi:FAD-binding oxidoreductase [Aspergillus mulundensis]|uniref:FAD-binding PCMH-type domain-containing protein n=1 Tax=Aspergillus mulundensis TaxID=1810919 RepID=A0A3D8SKT4_9EURO|nr:hypothetical protein DSM5745_03446 [Aspergillus mulundensis]RDW86804.1 hypothetical protein DSM5745_03446 [Aspergillus mulundensis]